MRIMLFAPLLGDLVASMILPPGARAMPRRADNGPTHRSSARAALEAAVSGNKPR